MSKINGDKARKNLRDRKQAKMRVKRLALRDSSGPAAKATKKTN